MGVGRRYSCYVLKCKENKYYTGSTETRKIQERFQKHLTGKGSKWCRQFPPLEVVKTIDNLLSSEAFNLENVFALCEKTTTYKSVAAETSCFH